jgi:VCBS repeat-containing protein
LTVDGAPVDPHATAIFGDTEASLTEDDTFPATGTLTVFDLDSDEAHTQSVLNGASQNGYGTYSVDSDGNWSYTLDNGLVQNLAPDDQISDSFVVFSLDGTASTTVTVTVDGVNDAPTLLVNSNLVAFYDFDEVSGTTAHDQSGGHDGTIDGATYVPGVTGTALQFDGSGDSVIVSDSPDWNFGTGDFSIQFWVNFSSVPGGSAGGPDAVLVGQDEGGGETNKFFISAYTGHLGFHVNSPTLGPQFFADTPFTPVVGEWYSIALTKSGSFYQFYINGEPGGSASQSFALPDADAPLTFGESEGFYFHGELRLSPRADASRGAADLSKRHRGGSGPARGCRGRQLCHHDRRSELHRSGRCRR